MLAWSPPPNLTVSEWADANRRLSAEGSAEHGQWRTSRAEYQRVIMDTVADAAIETIVIMSSAQVGKTEILNNIIGYYIDQDPSPIMVMQSSLDMARTWSTDRFSPMVRDTPVLSNKIADSKSRSTNNTILHKSFPGGHVTMTGANSPGSLASRPIRVLLCDEVDRYPVSAGVEGDPVSLAKKRTTTFWNRKIVLTSTPTIKGFSRIEAEFDKSDQRHFYTFCPHCNHQHTLKWENVLWPKVEVDGTAHHQPEHAHMVCPQCGSVIEEKHKARMVKHGEWIAHGTKGRIAGFHFNELISPWRTWAEVVTDFLEAKGSQETLKAWVNTSLGESFELNKGQDIDAEGLKKHQENWGLDSIPDSVLLLTAGVDVQKDRLEYKIVGWDANKVPYDLCQVMLFGDPTENQVWQDLDEALTSTYCGLRIAGAAIDSGYLTDHVYAYTKSRSSRRIFATKGVPGMGKPLSTAPKPTGRNRVMVYQIGADTAKRTILSWLGKPGVAIRFSVDLETEHFDQLTSEKLITKYKNGRPYLIFMPTRERNEALDCLAGAYAAFDNLNPNLNIIAAKRQPVEVVDAVVEEEDSPLITPIPPNARPVRRQRASFAKRY